MAKKPDKQVNFSFEFVAPEDHMMTKARAFALSAQEDYRSVGKAVLDVTAEAIKIRDGMQAISGGDDVHVDLAPYLDFWFADAIMCANRLQYSDDQDARDLAGMLISMEKSVIKSKESLLGEMKRVDTKPS